eukprot:gene6175-biopygen1547
MEHRMAASYHTIIIMITMAPQHTIVIAVMTAPPSRRHRRDHEHDGLVNIEHRMVARSRKRSPRRGHGLLRAQVYLRDARKRADVGERLRRRRRDVADGGGRDAVDGVLLVAKMVGGVAMAEAMARAATMIAKLIVTTTKSKRTVIVGSAVTVMIAVLVGVADDGSDDEDGEDDQMTTTMMKRAITVGLVVAVMIAVLARDAERRGATLCL